MSTIIGTTLNADTIRKTGGSLGTDIRIKNTSVYESDGGTSVTQNLVQGLIKVWHHGSLDGTTLEDSFNVGSMTDTGTGRQTVNLTNNMANVNYAPQTGVHFGQSRFLFMENVATSSYQSTTYNSNDNGYTDANQNSQVTGDLA